MDQDPDRISQCTPARPIRTLHSNTDPLPSSSHPREHPCTGRPACIAMVPSRCTSRICSHTRPVQSVCIPLDEPLRIPSHATAVARRHSQDPCCRPIRRPSIRQLCCHQPAPRAAADPTVRMHVASQCRCHQARPGPPLPNWHNRSDQVQSMGYHVPTTTSSAPAK